MNRLNSITILPENIRLLQILTEAEIGEVMKAVFFHWSGVEPDEAELSSDKIRLTYEILKNQIDQVTDLPRTKSWKSNLETR